MKRVIVLCIALAISNNICLASSVYLPPLQPVKAQSQSSTDNDTASYSPTPQENYYPSETNSENYDYDANKNLQSNQDSQVNPDQKLSNIAPLAPDSNVNYPKIDEIEKLIYGKSYTKQGLNVRLARIEKSLFKQTYDNLPLSQRVDKIVMNFNGGNNQIDSGKIPDKELSKLEQKVFGRNFSNSNADDRLSHLEEQVFGASQSGDDTSRYNRLSAAIRHYNQSQPGNFDEQLAGMQPKRGIRGFLSNLGQVLSGGTMTGFTPSIDTMDLGGMNSGGYSSYNSYNNYYPSRSYYPSYNTLNTGYNSYNPYNPYYNQAQRYNGINGQSGMYRGVRTNTGYYDSFRSFGNGCGVNILD